MITDTLEGLALAAIALVTWAGCLGVSFYATLTILEFALS